MCDCPLFVLVVSVGGDDFGVEDLVYEAMFLRDAVAPLFAAIAAQLPGVAGAGAAMQGQFGKEFHYILETFATIDFISEVLNFPSGLMALRCAAVTIFFVSLFRYNKKGQKKLCECAKNDTA